MPDDHDKLDQNNTQDPDMPQALGGPLLFASEQSQPVEVQQVDASVPVDSSVVDGSSIRNKVPCSNGDELIEILSGVEKQIERLRGLHLSHEQKLNSISQRSRNLEEAELSLDSSNSSLLQREENIEEKARELSDLQQQLDLKQTEFEQDQQSFAKEQDAQEQQRAELKKQRKALDIELESLKEQHVILAQRQETLAIEENQFQNEKEQAQASLSDIAQAQASNENQQIDDAAEKVSELEDQIKLLNEELANRDIALDEITQKGESGDLQLQERFKALSEEHKQLEDTLKEQGEKILHDEQAQLTIKQQQEQIEQLKSQLNDLSSKFDTNLMQKKDERIEDLVEALRHARGQVASDQSDDESQDRIAQLAAENEQLRTQLDSSTNSSIIEEQTLDSPLPSFQPSIESIELENVKTDDKNIFRGTDPSTQAEVKVTFDNPVVGAPQAYMNHNTGAAKTIATLGWLAVASFIIAGISWMAANQYFPATVSASVTFNAESQSNVALTNEQKQTWQTWHTNLLTDSGFTAKLAIRLADRRLDQYADVNTLRNYLTENLAVDLAQTSAITITLAGTNKNEIQALLDTLAATFISESDESLKSNSDGLKTRAVGTKRQGNQVLYSSLNPTPILDERIKYASFIFIAGFAGAVILVSRISRRSIRPTDIFAESDPIFVTPE